MTGPELHSPTLRQRLLRKLQTLSVAYGDFTLSSGAKSSYYLDCRLTTLDPEGACLIGEEFFAMIERESARLGVQPEAVGGLTMGADPISLAVAMTSWMKRPQQPLQAFTVRKAPKAHGKTKLIEGNFRPGMSVVVIDDTVTTGDSTVKALEAVQAEGGKVAFVAVLVDRQEGARERITALGHEFCALVNRDELVEKSSH